MSYNNLTENSPMAEQPVGLSTKLKPHQLTSIHAMLEMERNGKVDIIRPDKSSGICRFIRYSGKNIDGDNTNFCLHTQAGLLVDDVETGKLHTVIGLIETKPKVEQSDMLLKGEEKFHITYKSLAPTVRSNLIVLPSTKINQWLNAFDNSSLKVLKITETKDLDQFYAEPELQIVKPRDVNHNDHSIEYRRTSETKLPNGTEIKQDTEAIYAVRHLDNKKINMYLQQYDVIILNIDLHREFDRVFAEPRWSRVIVDGVDTTIPATFEEEANYYWFISATPRDIYTRVSSRFVHKFFGNYEEFTEYFQVKNDPEFVKKSMETSQDEGKRDL